MIDIIYTVWIRDVERLAYFIVSIQSMKDYANFHGIEHKYIVAVETQDMILRDEFDAYCRKEGVEVHYKHSPASLCSMMNFAHALGDNPYILFMQDDWQLVKHYDFARGVARLQEHDKWSVLRYRNAKYEGAIDVGGGLWELSPESDAYYYSDNPHLKKRNYHTFTGPFKVGRENRFDGAMCEAIMNRDAKKIGHEHKIISVKDYVFCHLGNKRTVIRPIEQEGR